MIREIEVDAATFKRYKDGHQDDLMAFKNLNIGSVPVTVRIVCHTLVPGRTLSRMAEVRYKSQGLCAFLYSVELLIKGPL